MAADQSVEALRDIAMTQVQLAPADYLIVLPVAICFLFGAGLLVMRKGIGWHPVVAIPGLVLLLAVDIGIIWRVWTEGPMTMMMGGWLPPFGIAFTVDLMGALFLATSGFVALACGIYASTSISRTELRYGFYPFLFMMMGGISGAFLTGDIFNLYVWFEVLLIGSFGLMVLGSRLEQLDGAVKYCFINLVGTTFFLIATGYLYGIFGTLNMADIAIKAGEMEDTAPIFTLASLYLVSFAMKAAAFPLNNWLPASYHTPRFVTSAIFAGLLTKVGIYAAIRVLLMLFPPERAELSSLISWIAALTMLIGAFGALAHSDIRRLLNYMVIAGIGTVLVGLALPPIEAGASDGPIFVGLSGAIFYALHSIVVMAALYLAAGVAVGISGSSSLHHMGGIWRAKPLFSAIMLVLLFAVSGLPPFSGFWPKVFLVRATITADMPWLAATVLLTGFLLTIASARIFALGFWRPVPEAALVSEGRVAHRVDAESFGSNHTGGAPSMVPLLILTGLVVVAGVWPEWLLKMTDAAAIGILDPETYLQSVFGDRP